MNTIGRAENRPASSSGNAGSSHAAASIAGTTVTAPNSHPGHRPGLFAGLSVPGLFAGLFPGLFAGLFPGLFAGLVPGLFAGLFAAAGNCTVASSASVSLVAPLARSPRRTDPL